ncbi:MAG: precorrin-6A synthase (deacetylating) [Acidimicrobiales bacterium]
MTRIAVIGVGMGEPDHLTGQAVAALNSVDVFFVLDKGSAADELFHLRHDLCQRVITSHPYRFVDVEDPRRDRGAVDYGRAVAEWIATRAAALGEAIRRELGPDERGGLLAWGDPAFYDSTLRVLDALPDPVDVEVVPGLSSIQMLAAAHRISVTRVGRPVQVTTGRRLAACGFPPDCDDVVVMLDAECSFRDVDPAGVTIYWGAYLGSAHQILISGELAAVAHEIVAARADAKLRRGWVMDTYLLRRGS